ncbi:MAG TPA: MFS transporter [Thermoanaerobaculia bacterium]|jgi:EmrB/QacA subfamily drug resistance transporter|nr:MFS transporter [Thermoanaerobaculia bacterium]
MTRSRPAAVLTIILVSYFMIVLDISIVITALPKIQQTLRFTATGLSWVQSAYMLAFGGLLLLGARGGDIVGRKRMFIIGIALFTAASMGVGLATSALWLIAGRAVQGIGAAILAPSTLALLQSNFEPGPARTRAVAYYGAVAGLGTSFGLVLGGILTDWISWRAGFFINLPVGIALMLAAQRYVVETERHAGEFDLIGAITSTLGMTALVYGIVRSADAGWSDARTIIALAAAIVLIAILIVNEWRAAQPIMPLRLFASRERSGAYAARILFLGAMMGFWFFMTQYLQSVMGYSPLAAGLAFLPMTIANFIMALAVPRLTQRFGNGRLLAAGLVITLIGMALLSRIHLGIPYAIGIALPMIVIGIGQGASLSPLTASGIAGVAAEDAGAAAGLVNVAHQIGGSLGLGILVVVFTAAGSVVLHGKALLAHRVATALAAGSGMLALAAVLVFLVIVRAKHTYV